MPQPQELTPPEDTLDKTNQEENTEQTNNETPATTEDTGFDTNASDLQEPVEEPKEQEKPEEEEKPAEPTTSDIAKGLNDLGTMVQTLGQQVEGIQERISTPPPVPEPIQEEQQPSEDEFEPATKKDARQLAEEAVKTAKEKEIQAQTAEEKRKQEADDWLDKADKMLEADGYLKSIKDPNDPNDAGNKSRAELYGFMARKKTEDVGEAAKTIKEYHEMGMGYDPVKNKLFKLDSAPNPGKTAPVNMPGSQTAPADGLKKPSTKQIENPNVGLSDIVEAATAGEEQ